MRTWPTTTVVVQLKPTINLRSNQQALMLDVTNEEQLTIRPQVTLKSVPQKVTIMNRILPNAEHLPSVLWPY